MTKFLFLVALLFSIASVLPQRSLTQPSETKTVYIPFADAKQVVSTLAKILPPELRGKDESEIATLWPGWVTRRDAEIRARLAQGDEDSLVNFALFGTSFTKQPRMTLAQVQQIRTVGDFTSKSLNASADPVSRLIAARLNDLVRASLVPRGNDRLVFVRKILTDKGFNLGKPAGREQAKTYLAVVLQRVVNENSAYSRVLEAAQLQGDATEEFAQRSRLFRVRGLSSDTSLLPNYAIEQALKEIMAQGLFSLGSVSRVAVIGPGLDFIDKQEGYDFYPQQTIQPLAIMDTLLRLRLANADGMQVVTFDLSPRVNNHILQARNRAAHGRPYVVQLPRDEQARWTPEAIRYWEHFGDQIGSPVTPAAVPASAGEIKIRAMRVRPAFVSQIWPVDTNIVLQRLEPPAAAKFDLIIATNILVYYDNFDQSLAMINVERMLKPGGFMLSNNAVLELPFFRVRSVGFSSVAYSSKPNDGDHIVWYRRSPD